MSAASARATAAVASHAQRRLLCVEQLAETPLYNLVRAVRLTGPLDAGALEAAANGIVCRHEILRTRFVDLDGVPHQFVERSLVIGLRRLDLSSFDDGEQWRRVDDEVSAESQTPFNPATGPLFRMTLIKLAEADHVMIRTVHHLVFDGWSEAVFNRECSALYEAHVTGTRPTLAPLPLQYSDYTRWQQARAAGDSESLAYWRRQLGDRVDGTPPGAAGESPRSARRLTTSVAAALLTRARGLGRQGGATLYMTLLSILSIVLWRHHQLPELVVATPTANRRDRRFEPLIGLFADLLLLRFEVGPHLRADELLTAVRRTVLDAHQHADVPLDRVLDELGSQTRRAAAGIAHVTFALQNMPVAPLHLPGLTVTPIEQAVFPVRGALVVHAAERDRGLDLSWYFDTARFTDAEVQTLARDFASVLEQVCATPSVRLGRVDGPPSDATHGPRERAIAREQRLDELFREEVLARPDGIAMVAGDRRVSYHAAYSYAQQVAGVLRDRGTGVESRVGLYMPRSIEQVIGTLGTVLCGATYVPLDVGWPGARVDQVVRDAGLSVILTTDALRAEATAFNVPVVSVNDCGKAPPADALAAVGDAGAAAYLLYTSGSTGRPKGVVVPHAAITAYAKAVGAAAEWGQGRSFAWVQPLSVDSSATVFWGALCSGGMLHVIDELTATTGPAFASRMRMEDIEVLKIAPSHLAALERDGALVDALVPRGWLIVGGEKAGGSWMTRLQAARPGSRIFNHYGPTETTVGVSMHRFGLEDMAGATVPLGAPLGDSRLYVLDAALRPVSPNSAGELYVSGPWVARGYWRQPALTAARFVADPFGPPGSRMYRTGDRAQRRSAGTLEFLGRTDDQVKVRGHRIELGDVEAALAVAAGVEQAVVVHCDGPDGHGQLTGYVVGVAADLDAIRRRLQRLLPAHMVPAALAAVPEWQRTPHGKIDRHALRSRPAVPRPHSLPRTSEEAVLCELFAAVLGVARVDPEDDFFELGGHSLLATQLVSRIRDALGGELTIRTLFDAPRVRTLAAQLRSTRAPERPIIACARPPRVPLSFMQQRLWAIDRLHGATPEYNLTQGLRLRGPLDRHALSRAVTAILARHESLRSRIVEVAGQAVQIVDPPSRVDVPLDHMTASGDGRDPVIRALEREQLTPLVLSQGVTRFRLLRVEDDEYVFFRTVHHIAFDGWSQGIFNRELDMFYRGFRDACRVDLPSLPLQYADFTLWQHQRSHDGAYEPSLDYWTRRLAGARRAIDLGGGWTSGDARPAMASRKTIPIAKECIARLMTTCREARATPYMACLAAFGVALSRHTHQDDVVVGTPLASRQTAQLEGLIGLFANAVAVRMRVSPRVTTGWLLHDVRQHVLEALQHQEVPLEQVMRRLWPDHQAHEAGPFNVMFLFDHAPAAAPRLADLDVCHVERSSMPRRVDLACHVGLHEAGATLAVLFDPARIADDQVDALARTYVGVLDAYGASLDRVL